MDEEDLFHESIERYNNEIETAFRDNYFYCCDNESTCTDYRRKDTRRAELPGLTKKARKKIYGRHPTNDTGPR